MINETKKKLKKRQNNKEIKVVYHNDNKRHRNKINK